MTFIERKFTIRHAFDDFLRLASDGNEIEGKQEEHFGCFWKISVFPDYSHSRKEIDDCFIALYCENPRNSGEWSVTINWELMVESSEGMELISCETKDFSRAQIDTIFEFEDEEVGSYLIDGTLTVEFNICIKKMTGMQLFDESMKKYSDVVLIVENEKFHVLKLFLASQSSYFEALLLGNFNESTQSEVTLTGIKASDFQNYLEALHGHSVIDDKTVNGIIELANMYDTPSIIQRCQTFLIEHSNKEMREKLRLAGDYELTQLKWDCLRKIKTVDDIRAAVPTFSAERMDHQILACLFEKLMELQPKPAECILIQID